MTRLLETKHIKHLRRSPVKAIYDQGGSLVAGDLNHGDWSTLVAVGEDIEGMDDEEALEYLNQRIMDAGWDE